MSLSKGKKFLFDRGILERTQINNENKLTEKKLTLAIPGLLVEGVGDEDGPVEC